MANNVGRVSTQPSMPVGVRSTNATKAPSVAPSPLVQQLVKKDATVYSSNLAKVPLPPRSDGMVRPEPKKPAGEMKPARDLEGGRSPLAPTTLANARQSFDLLGTTPNAQGIRDVVGNAHSSADMMPSRHGLVAYTRTNRGDVAYLTQERWQHIRENHMLYEPSARGKRVTTFWPTKFALEGASMNDNQVLSVIVDAIRGGTLRNEIRDTRLSEYDLPQEQAAQYGVSEVKVSMAPDGLVLSSYPTAGTNLLAVREITPEEAIQLSQLSS